jgi:hypothetical protein
MARIDARALTPRHLVCKVKTMIPRLLSNISVADLTSLVAEKVREDKTIEYKREVPQDKFDILKDVSALANTQGGDLVFGIEEGDGDNRGVPVSPVGVTHIDESVRRILDIVRTGLQPPLLLKELNFKAVELPLGTFVLVLRVPESLAGPHQIRERHVFYGRNSAGNYLMDARELRTAFALRETLAERIRAFRLERVAKIKSDDTPVAVEDGPRLILHMIPLSAFLAAERIDIGVHLDNLRAFVPLSRSTQRLQSMGYRINLDGLVNYYGTPQAARSYTQVYRSGIVEAVKPLSYETFGIEEEPHLVSNQFPSQEYKGYEGQLIDGVRLYERLLVNLGLQHPIYVFITLCDVSGYRLFASHQVSAARPARMPLTTCSQGPIDQNDLFLPEEIIESPDAPTDAVLRPLFDMIWNAAGEVSCPNYDQEGHWLGL